MQVELSYISILFFLLSACTNPTNKQDKEQKSVTVDTANRYQKSKNENDTLLINWKKDSLGCLHIRTYEDGLLLAKRYELNNKSIDAVSKLLGKPNRIILDGKTKVLRYHCNTCCENGQLKKECDYSWVDFTFTDSTINKCIVTSGIM